MFLQELPDEATISDGEVYEDLTHLEKMLDFDRQAKAMGRDPLPFFPSYIVPFLDVDAMRLAWATQDYALIRSSYVRAFIAYQEETIGFTCELTPGDFMALYAETAV